MLIALFAMLGVVDGWLARVGASLGAEPARATSRRAFLRSDRNRERERLLLAVFGRALPAASSLSASETTVARRMGNAIRDGLVDGIKGTVGVVGDLGEKLLGALKSGDQLRHRWHQRRDPRQPQSQCPGEEHRHRAAGRGVLHQTALRRR